MAKEKRLKLNLDGPCPCASGLLLRACCLAPNGHLRKRRPDLVPPGPLTGREQPGCFLSETMNCSADLSEERYVSKPLLEALAAAGASCGTLWLASGEKHEIDIKKASPKFLCTRHQAALAGLDDEVATFFNTFQTIQADRQRHSLSRKLSFILYSGETIELWLLKIAIGFFHTAKAAKGRHGIVKEPTLNEAFVLDALHQGIWTDGCGLYVRALADASVENAEPHADASENRILGAELAAGGLEFRLIFDPTDLFPHALEKQGWMHRPTELGFEIEHRAHHIGLTWPPGTPPRTVMIKSKVRAKSDS